MADPDWNYTLEPPAYGFPETPVSTLLLRIRLVDLQSPGSVADRDNLAVNSHHNVTVEQLGVVGYVPAHSPQSMLEEAAGVVIEINHDSAPMVMPGSPVGEEQVQRFSADSPLAKSCRCVCR
jgi:hypothetical protein